MDASLSTEPCWVKLVSSSQVEFGKMSAEAEYRQPTEPQRLDSSTKIETPEPVLELCRQLDQADIKYSYNAGAVAASEVE